MVVGEFGQVTSDLGAVVRRLNDRFGTSWSLPQLDEEMLRECKELVTARSSLSPILLNFESGLVSRSELRSARGKRGTGSDLWRSSPRRRTGRVGAVDRGRPGEGRTVCQLGRVPAQTAKASLRRLRRLHGAGRPSPNSMTVNQ